MKKLVKKPIYKVINFLGEKGFFFFLPSRYYLRLMYRARMGKKLNLKHPESFNEKLQWLKLNKITEKYSYLVDKYEVRKYIEKEFDSDLLIPIYGVWNKFEDINWSVLPDQFVIKCTHDSGGNYICRNKMDMNYEFVKNKIKRSMKRNYYNRTREYPYKSIKPRIIIEKYMEDTKKKDIKGLTDYKFFCFNGDPKFLYVSRGLENHKTAEISFFDMLFNRMPFKRKDYNAFKKDPKKPYNFDYMVQISKKISKDFDFVRVDLYEIDNKVYFSEVTFFPCSGYLPFDPIEYDSKIGKLIEIK